VTCELTQSEWKTISAEEDKTCLTVRDRDWYKLIVAIHLIEFSSDRQTPQIQTQSGSTLKPVTSEIVSVIKFGYQIKLAPNVQTVESSLSDPFGIYGN
jgi:hypothetical protein